LGGTDKETLMGTFASNLDVADKLVALIDALEASQATTITKTFSTAGDTIADATAVDVATTASTTTTPYGYTTAAQADGIVTNLNAAIADIAVLRGLIVTLVDALQSVYALT
jgi:hypothetical protein